MQTAASPWAGLFLTQRLGSGGLLCPYATSGMVEGHKLAQAAAQQQASQAYHCSEPRAAEGRLGLLLGLPYPGLPCAPVDCYWTPLILKNIKRASFLPESSFTVLCPQGSWGASPMLASSPPGQAQWVLLERDRPIRTNGIVPVVGTPYYFRELASTPNFASH